MDVSNMRSVRMISPNDNSIKIFQLGYAWTIAIFGLFALLFRGEWVESLISLGLIFLSTILGLPIFVAWIAWFIWAVFANERRLDRLLQKGWRYADND